MRYFDMLFLLWSGCVMLCAFPAVLFAIYWDAGVGGLLLILVLMSVGLSGIFAAIVIPLVNIAENLEKLTTSEKNPSQNPVEAVEP